VSSYICSISKGQVGIPKYRCNKLCIVAITSSFSVSCGATRDLYHTHRYLFQLVGTCRYMHAVQGTGRFKDPCCDDRAMWFLLT
jgi:hypothetical protein